MLLKELSELNGVSGDEKTVRDFILEHLKHRLQGKLNSCRTDQIGNLLIEKKGIEKGSDVKMPKILVCAHMDEIGLMVTDITAEGYLKFQTVGGIEPGILIAKTVIFNSGLQGVIGLKAVHLQKTEERKKIPDIDDLYIDIGASSKTEAENVVKLGDYVTFPTIFEEIGSGLYKGKALDDRVGCAVIMELLEQDYPCDLTAVFTVQEEVGLRGSKVVSNYLQADLALVVEATSAADFTESERENWIVTLGNGPACSLIDSATIYKPGLVQKVITAAEKNSIPLQFRQGAAAANDAGNIHQAGIGIPTITLSVPCRNIHTMSSMISKNDYQHCVWLLQCILNDIHYFLNLNIS
jgi:endoglucanase